MDFSIGRAVSLRTTIILLRILRVSRRVGGGWLGIVRRLQSYLRAVATGVLKLRV